MSTSISIANSEYGPFGGGIQGQVLSDSLVTHRQLDTLTEQAGSGLIADTYAGLGNGAATALAVQPALTSLQTWQTDISAATGPMQVSQTALTQISAIASGFYAQIDTLNGLNPSAVDSVAASARDALRQMAGLLDETDAGVYVFAGQDSANPPVPNPDGILNSGYFTQIQQAVASLVTNGGGATIAATMTIATSNAAGTSPFSGALSQPATSLAGLRPTIATGAGQHAPVGILASANADVASVGSSTSGSYMRDIMRALATLGSLSSSQVGATGFSQLVADTGASLGGAITALNQDAGVLGDRQTQLQTRSSMISSTTLALQAQLSGAQSVDMATTLSQLTQTQTRLQASYQLIATLQSLSLVKFLPAGG